MFVDDRALSLDQFGEPANQIAPAGIRIAMRIVGDRMAADLHFLTIGQHELQVDH